MRTTPVLLALLVSLGLSGPGLASQTVWKWVDANGVTHYSDRPVPGATKVDINVGKSSSPTPPVATSSSSSPSEAKPDAAAPYRNFEIWKPGNDENVINTGGVVPVEVRVDPVLQPGHSLFLYLDGRLVEGHPDNTSSFELKQVPRGMHTLRAIINAGSGTRVQETAQVVFNVQQTSVAQPPVGPTLKPPAKPRPSPQRKAGNQLPSKQPKYGELNDVRTAVVDPRTNWPAGTKPNQRAPFDSKTNLPADAKPDKPATKPSTTPKATPTPVKGSQ